MTIQNYQNNALILRSTQKGFTLIELMVVIVIMGILLAIAIPSYQAYIRKTDLAVTQQEMQRIAEQLARHKNRNFNYKGFDASYLYKDNTGNLNPNFNVTEQKITLPLNNLPIPPSVIVDPVNVKYTISIIGFYTDEKIISDPADDIIVQARLNSTSTANLGQSWAIKAESNNLLNYNVLISSNGIRCMNKKNKEKVTYESCGTELEGSEQW